MDEIIYFRIFVRTGECLVRTQEGRPTLMLHTDTSSLHHFVYCYHNDIIQLYYEHKCLNDDERKRLLDDFSELTYHIGSASDGDSVVWQSKIMIQKTPKMTEMFYMTRGDEHGQVHRDFMYLSHQISTTKDVWGETLKLFLQDKDKLKIKFTFFNVSDKGKKLESEMIDGSRYDVNIVDGINVIVGKDIHANDALSSMLQNPKKHLSI